MTDTIYKPYVVMVRDHRVDAAGPFKDIHAAAFWAEQWREWTDDDRCHVAELRDCDVPKGHAADVSHPRDLAFCCAPSGFDQDAAREWADDNAQHFLRGFPVPDYKLDEIAP